MRGARDAAPRLPRAAPAKLARATASPRPARPSRSDPYAAIKGFWYAHIGWMLVKQDKTRIGKADISDLDRDPMIAFQHRAYPFFALFFGIALPTLVCGLAWNDWYGGYFIAAVARLVFVQHSTFFVNSLAHYAGSATYTDQHSARNSWITALLTLGEGYHNFHHEFPNDFRNGIEWYQYDPTKLFIAGAAALGLAWDLKEFPHNEVAKGQLQMRQKALDGAAAAGAPPAAVARRQRDLDAARAALNWGPAPAALPLWPKADFERRVKEARDRRDAGHADAPVFMILDGEAEKQSCAAGAAGVPTLPSPTLIASTRSRSPVAALVSRRLRPRRPAVSPLAPRRPVPPRQRARQRHLGERARALAGRAPPTPRACLSTLPPSAPPAGKVQGRRVQALQRGAEHAGHVPRGALAGLLELGHVPSAPALFSPRFRLEMDEGWTLAGATSLSRLSAQHEDHLAIQKACIAHVPCGVCRQFLIAAGSAS